MVFSLFYILLSILYLAGSSLCTTDHDSWDTVFPDGDPWDIESSREDSKISDVISLLGEGEVLIITHTPPTLFMIPITSESDQMSTEAADATSNEPMSIESVNQESIPSCHVSTKDVGTPKRRSYHNEYTGRRVAIGKRSKASDKVSEAFKNLTPITLKSDSLSQLQLDLKFLQQKNHHLWSEMIDYPLKKYYAYWGQVCDYFWYKSEPDDKRFRGCFITMIVNAHTTVRVRFHHIRENHAKVPILRCSCFYYIAEISKPDSKETVFAVHKYADHEYFLLDPVPETKVIFRIANFLTKVFLPSPFK